MHDAARCQATSAAMERQHLRAFLAHHVAAAQGNSPPRNPCHARVGRRRQRRPPRLHTRLATMPWPRAADAHRTRMSAWLTCNGRPPSRFAACPITCCRPHDDRQAALHRMRRLVHRQRREITLRRNGQPSRTLRVGLLCGGNQLVVLSPASAKHLRALGRERSGALPLCREAAAHDHARSSPRRRPALARHISRRSRRTR